MPLNIDTYEVADYSWFTEEQLKEMFEEDRVFRVANSKSFKYKYALVKFIVSED